ncbi:MAG TPA: glycosyltransferase family 4 protein [Thermoplasmata archaeon]|nr:glycosyltransferase family 4 protein [Thermoplasmata archaeon]
MRIVLTVLRYLPALGGSTRMVQLLAEGYASRGHTVTVVTQEEPSSPSEEEVGGVRVLRLRMSHAGRFRVPQGYLRLLRRTEADVFHLHGNRIWCADYYFPFARTFDWPQVITPHGFYHYWMRPGPLRVLYYERYFPGRLRAFQGYIALTEGERTQVEGWGYPPQRIRVIPNGIDLSEFDRTLASRDSVRAAWGLESPRIALTVGGCYDNKRVDRLVRAIAATRGEWGLVVVGPDVPGSPYDRIHCEQLAKELHAPVRFLGPQPRSSVLDAFSSSDAYVQASAFEGFGVSLLEAMAAGLPFIAFDAGAARELSRTGAGFCVSSEEEMVARLRELPERGVEMGRVARRAVPDWSSDRMVERHLDVYRSVQQRAPGNAQPPPPVSSR